MATSVKRQATTKLNKPLLKELPLRYFNLKGRLISAHGHLNNLMNSNYRLNEIQRSFVVYMIYQIYLLNAALDIDVLANDILLNQRIKSRYSLKQFKRILAKDQSESIFHNKIRQSSNTLFALIRQQF